jgi:polysaccharide chain length determinant protein (PEP-CTERM system associated)
MPDLSENVTSGQPDFRRIAEIGRRHYPQFLLVFFGVWLLVWGASWVMSPHYRSGTLILVEQPTTQQNYVMPNIGDDMQPRLESMTQQILSRTRLLVIVDKLHLYESDKRVGLPDERVERMRKDISVELVRDSSRNNITAFRIFYTAKDAHLAQTVTGELTNLFISENLKVRQNAAQVTTDFLQRQLDDARVSLTQQEANVKQFELQHMGELPSQQASNLQILSGLQSQLQNEEDALNASKQQRAYLQAMIDQERSAQKQTLTNNTGNASAGPTDLASLDQQLEKMHAQLAELRSNYTDNYPDVRRLKIQIASAEATRERLLAGFAQKSNDPKDADEGVVTADPIEGAAARQLQGQLQANQIEIKNRENSIAQLKGRVDSYQRLLNLSPATEQQLAVLARGYDQSKANYDDLLKKRDQSQIATNAEQMMQGQRFTILDPPSLPLKPVSPNRLKFCGIGLGAGLALGLALVGVFTLFDERIYNEDEIKGLLPFAVISEIPHFVSSADEAKVKRRTTLERAATVVVATCILAGAIFSYFRG